MAGSFVWQSKKPLPLIFAAGGAYGVAALNVFAMNLGAVTGPSWELLAAVLAIGLGWYCSLMAIWLACRTKEQPLFVCLLAVYWVVALVGLLFMASSSDPMPFYSTLVSAILSLLVAWIVANVLKENRKRSRRGWWRARKAA